MSSSWQTVRLGEMLSEPVRNGYSPVCGDVPTGAWVLGLGALGACALDVSRIKPAPVDVPAVERTILKCGDFLVSRSNTRDKVGRAAMWRGEVDSCSYPDLMMRFRVDERRLEPDYLEAYLRSPSARRHFQSAAAGTSGSMVKIGKGAIESLRVLLPPLAEQQRIADVLASLYTAVERAEQIIALKMQRAEWLSKELLSRDSGEWPHRRFDELFAVVTERTRGGEALLSVTQDSGVTPRAGLARRVQASQISIAGYKRIERGSFAVSLRSFEGGIEYSAYEGAISAAYTVLRSEDQANSSFYRHFFKSKAFIERYLAESVVGIRDGKQIDIPGLLLTRIPVPPISAQHRICEALDDAAREVRLERQRAAALRSCYQWASRSLFRQSDQETN